MADVSVTTAALAATGLTVFGVTTGLDPSLLIAGFAGGVWAQSYHPPIAWWRRLALTTLASILAGYLAPAAAMLAVSFEFTRQAFTIATLQLPLAVVIGLIAHRVLGPGLMRLGARKLEDLSK